MAGVDPADLVFLDETVTPTTLSPLRARAPRGARTVGTAPRNHGPSVTLLAAPGPGGIGPAVAILGAADGAAVEAYARELLGPSLGPGRVVLTT